MKAAWLPGMPQHCAEPVFAKPWQAQAFALALLLHQRGLFTWPEWAETLSQQIAAAQAAGDADLGDNYYRHWLAALEALVSAKGASTSEELARHRDAWEHAAQRTPHGRPIELGAEDFAARATEGSGLRQRGSPRRRGASSDSAP